MKKQKVKNEFRKTFLVKVVIKSKHPEKVPDFGLGKGVLMQQEVSFKDEKKRGFDTPLFALSMVEFENNLIKETVECKWEEK
jgi:hypothetical protein